MVLNSKISRFTPGEPEGHRESAVFFLIEPEWLADRKGVASIQACGISCELHQENSDLENRRPGFVYRLKVFLITQQCFSPHWKPVWAQFSFVRMDRQVT